jgi:hypothetical protein
LTERRRTKRARGPLLSLLVAVTPLVWAATICAGLWYSLRVGLPARVPESPQDSTHCVLVPPPAAGVARGSWDAGLYDWVALRDPTLLVLPNERFGFSRERFARLEIPCAPIPPYEFTMAPVGQATPPAIVLRGPAEPLAERVAGSREPIRPPPPEPVVPVPLARGVFWRLPDGRLLSGLPVPDERAVRAAVTPEAPVKAPTRLRVSRGERLATTRIQVLSSCGNTALDTWAVDALRRAVSEQELQDRLRPEGRAQAEYLPAPGSDTEVEVEWGLGSTT